MSEGVGVSAYIFHSAILEKSIDCLMMLWFLLLQQFEYFPVAYQHVIEPWDITSHGIFSLSLYSVVILVFILVGSVVAWYLLYRSFCCFDGIMLLFP